MATRRVQTPGIVTFQHGGVVVIESLPAGDLRTGRRLFEDVLEPIRYQRPELNCVLRTPTSAAELRSVLREICKLTWIPILHLEAHGNDDGIELGNGDFLTWDRLYADLQTINLRTENNLALVMSACLGMHALKVFATEDLAASPVRLVVGPQEVVLAGELEDGFKAFYRHVLLERDVKKGLASLRAAVPSIRWYSADQLFAAGMNKYLTHRGDISDEFFQHCKRRFLMIEHHPELESTFAAVSLVDDGSP